MNWQENIYRVNGIDMNVLIAGDGPPVLLVHGYPDTHKVWRNQIPKLVEAGYRVIAPDTRGCGRSEMLPNVGDYQLANLVGDLVGLLDILGIDKVRLVGHDWGAIISWQFALHHPERVDRYIALSVGHPTAYNRGGWKQKLKGYYILFLQLRGISEWLAQLGDWWLFRQMTRYPAEFPHWREQLSKPGRLVAGINYYRANLRQLSASEFPRARVPVVGIWSDGDLFLDEGQMLRTQDYCDGDFVYERIEGANHWLQLDAPDRVTPVLIRHLA